MKNKDEIIILCDELENCKKKSICDFNEIVCVKRALRKYINGDKDKILKLKVQLELHKKFRENTFSQLAFCVSVFSLIISTIVSVFNICNSINLNVQGETFIIAICILFFIIMIMVCATYNVYTSNCSRQKWMKYIEYALQDIEKEY